MVESLHTHDFLESSHACLASRDGVEWYDYSMRCYTTEATGREIVERRLGRLGPRLDGSDVQWTLNAI